MLVQRHERIGNNGWMVLIRSLILNGSRNSDIDTLFVAVVELSLLECQKEYFVVFVSKQERHLDLRLEVRMNRLMTMF